MKREEGHAIPLGIAIEGKKVNFSVEVKKEDTCELHLYKHEEKSPSYIFEMNYREETPGVRFLQITDLDEDIVEYDYKINDESFLDEYVLEVSGREKWGNEEKSLVRGKIIDVKSFSQIHALRIPEERVIAYRLHVRGFTMNPLAKVKAPGTFLGLIEKIPYLKNLGINQVQLLPSFEFIEEGLKINYWGYTQGFYMAPKSSYCASNCATDEFHLMIQECHKNGIEVVIDMPFVQGTSLIYQVECLRHYILYYHIDGFVLNPYVSNIEEIGKDPILRYIKLLTQNEGFQNTMRKFLKGDEGMVKDVIWNLRKSTIEENSLSYNYITNHNGFTLADLVSYDGKHNELNGERNQDGKEYNYCWNCGVEGPSRKKVVSELRKKQVRNAWALLLLAQGTPCILSGDEFGNSQNGNNNAYCQDNEISWLDWKLNNKNNKELYTYVKKLIELRNMHPILCQNGELQGMESRSGGMPDVSYHGSDAWITPDEIASRWLGVMYCGKRFHSQDCYVAYNMHWIKHEFALPSSEKGKIWYQILDTSTGEIGTMTKLPNQRVVKVEERSIAMYVSVQEED